MNTTINEIPPLTEKDCFYIVERYKSEFTFPIHFHEEFELNFIENGAGLTRIVGDSIETTTEYDLVLICCENLEHAWLQGECTSASVREITIQFSQEMFPESILKKNQFDSIRKMFDKAKRGLAFSNKSIMQVYSSFNTIVNNSGFDQIINIIQLLYKLSLCSDTKELSNSSFAQTKPPVDSRRVEKVHNYIQSHYQNPIRLNTLAELVGMTPTAFSRFFKLRTGYNLTEYISNIRLGVATRQLIDTTKSISEICFDCGFNNISNFNRLFKTRKQLTPKTFREIYQKKKIIV